MKTFVIGDVHGRRAQLRRLVEMLPRDPAIDTLVLVGDLVDRGEDVPGVVADVLEWKRKNPERFICLRGNHEQMLLDFIDRGTTIWLHTAVGGERTFEQYTGHPLIIKTEEDFAAARRELTEAIPSDHLELFRQLPLYHEDDYAFYVHAGLDGEKHPRDTAPEFLLWARDSTFFKHYCGKPCVFGHTPTPLLPFFGRLGHHGIYISHSVIGIDTGYNHSSPLSCLQLPDFMLYQTFANGRAETHHITTFIPEPLRSMQKAVGRKQ